MPLIKNKDTIYLKHKKIYEKVNKLYLNGGISIAEACKKSGISKQGYYNIKKQMDVDKIASDVLNKKMDNIQTGSSLVRREIYKQQPQNEQINNYIASQIPPKDKIIKKSNLRDILNVIKQEKRAM